jgi:hypothetical protein
VAALWLAYHGRHVLLARHQGRVPLQHVFLKLLGQTARPWDEGQMGAGIVDANALLRAPLPRPTDVVADFPDDPMRMLTLEEVTARMIAEPDPVPVRTQLEGTLGLDPALETAAAAEERAEVLRRFGPELLHILAEDRAAALQLRASVRAAPLEGVSPLPGEPVEATPPGGSEFARFGSPSLRAQLRA